MCKQVEPSIIDASQLFYKTKCAKTDYLAIEPWDVMNNMHILCFQDDVTYLGCYIDETVRDIGVNRQMGDKNKPSVCSNFCKTSGKMKLYDISLQLSLFCSHM